MCKSCIFVSIKVLVNNGALISLFIFKDKCYFMMFLTSMSAVVFCSGFKS